MTSTNDSHNVTVGNIANSGVIIGNDNQVTGNVGPTSGITAADLAAIKGLFDDLNAQIAAEAPPEQRDAALERAGELHDAIVADKPDRTTIEYVTSWFKKHLPKLAGAIAGVLVNPVVGSVIAAAGTSLTDE
jgi:hypothetical protein